MTPTLIFDVYIEEKLQKIEKVAQQTRRKLIFLRTRVHFQTQRKLIFSLRSSSQEKLRENYFSLQEKFLHQPQTRARARVRISKLREKEN